MDRDTKILIGGIVAIVVVLLLVRSKGNTIVPVTGPSVAGQNNLLSADVSLARIFETGRTDDLRIASNERIALAGIASSERVAGVQADTTTKVAKIAADTQAQIADINTQAARTAASSQATHNTFQDIIGAIASIIPLFKGPCAVRDEAGLCAGYVG